MTVSKLQTKTKSKGVTKVQGKKTTLIKTENGKTKMEIKTLDGGDRI